MKSLFFSIFAILIIASCETSTSPDTKEEGQRIGTWMVYSNSADWIGTRSQSKAKSFTTQAEGDTAETSIDTVYYEQPDRLSMSLYRLSGWEQNAAGFQLVDSSYSPRNLRINLNNPLQELPGLADGQKGSEYVHFRTAAFSVVCDSTYSSDEHIIITYRNETISHDRPGHIEKVFKINTTGVVDAAKTLAGCFN